MEPLFPGAPQDLPPRITATWVVRPGDPPPRAPLRHVAGYGPLVALAERFGTDPRTLLDPWTFAHFIRAHRAALEADAALMRAAVVFLGNALVARTGDTVWSQDGRGIESEHREEVEVEEGVWMTVRPQRSIRIEGTVPAILEADEARFLEFAGVVDSWS